MDWMVLFFRSDLLVIGAKADTCFPPILREQGRAVQPLMKRRNNMCASSDQLADLLFTSLHCTSAIKNFALKTAK